MSFSFSQLFMPAVLFGSGSGPKLLIRSGSGLKSEMVTVIIIVLFELFSIIVP